MFDGVLHCVKSVCIRSFSDPYFPAFGLNMERYSVCEKIRTRKTPNTDTFHEMLLSTSLHESNRSLSNIMLFQVPATLTYFRPLFPFYTPQKSIGKLDVFWWFQVVHKGNINVERVNFFFARKISLLELILHDVRKLTFRFLQYR